MEKIYDVTALGELLIDFTENGTSAQENSTSGSQSGRCTVQCTCHA